MEIEGKYSRIESTELLRDSEKELTKIGALGQL